MCSVSLNTCEISVVNGVSHLISLGRFRRGSPSSFALSVQGSRQRGLCQLENWTFHATSLGVVPEVKEVHFRTRSRTGPR